MRARVHHDRLALRVHDVLVVAREMARGLRALAQRLHRVHDLHFLVQECLAQVAQPLRALAHAREQIGKGDAS